MSAYYNEFDPYAAAWLRNLIKAGLIAPGDVDERSITEVMPDDLKGYTQCHFFAGIGGWSYALRLAGWDDARPVWTGSCPCQPFSSQGSRKRQQDERHLWPHWYRLIRESAPAIIFGEQVNDAIAAGWLDEVMLDMEAISYACAAVDLPACAAAAPHLRERVWFLCRDTPCAWPPKEQKKECWSDTGPDRVGDSNNWWARTRYKPPVSLLDNGLPSRMGRLRGYGNAIVPQVAGEFIKAAMDC